MSAQTVRFTCRGCGSDILGDSGWLVVDLDEVMRVQDAYQAHDEAHPTGLFTVDSLIDLPERATWKAWHRHCDPDPGANGYWIESGRIATWPQAIWWAAHLLEKNWLTHTNWDDILRWLAATDGGSTGAAA